MDFVEFINSEWTATVAKKTAMLDSFVEQYGYEEEVDDGEGNMIPNPVSKKDFANEKFVKFVVETVNAARRKAAESVVEYEELEF